MSRSVPFIVMFPIGCEHTCPSLQPMAIKERKDEQQQIWIVQQDFHYVPVVVPSIFKRNVGDPQNSRRLPLVVLTSLSTLSPEILDVY